MGYTHNWTRPFSEPLLDWETIRADVSAIIATSEVPVFERDGVTPYSPGEPGSPIRFDPAKGVCGETFYVVENGTENGFCKTNEYAYDEIVAAVLCYLESVAGILVVDGFDPEDYEEGLALARRALPQHADILQLPLCEIA